MFNIENLKTLFKTRLTLGIILSFLLIIILSFLLTLFMFVLQPDSITDVLNNFVQSNFLNLLLNYLPVLFMMLLLFFISNSLTLSVGITSFIIIVLSLVNRYKILLRDDPFFPWDISLGTELIGIAEGYGISRILLAVIFIIILIIGIIFAYCVVKTQKLKPIYRVICSLVSIIVMFILNATVYHNTNLINSLHVNGNVFNQVNTFNSRGFLYSFIYAHNVHRISIPDNFNIAPINQIINDFNTMEITDNIVTPHIIMIMSEAFSEMSLNQNVDFQGHEHHPQYYYEQLIEREELIYGHLVVPNLGGGTADTEFDVLTGLNTRNLRGAPFSYRLITNYFESLPWLLEDLGYRSVALHPGFRWFYNRQNVYRFFGFEYFYDITYFDDNQYKGMYVSEEATMDKIIDIFKTHLNEHPNVPLFNFNVTIQNHGPYTDKYMAETNFNTTLDLSEAEMNPVSNYFHGLKDNDTELQKLIEYFEYHEEPVVLVYYSDHLPAFSQDVYGQFFPDIYDTNSLESTIRLHTVPFLIWQNEAARKITPIEENFQTAIMPDNMTISSNFLGAYLMELLGFSHISPFINYVNNLRGEFPIILENMSADINGNISLNMSQEELEPLIIYKNWQIYKIFN